MFGNCVWLFFKGKNNFRNIIKKHSEKFSTQLYEPHITFLYDIENNLEYKNLNINEININKIKISNFFKSGDIYKTQFKNFYAIQQDYLLNNNPNKVYHISLAYKVDNNFSQEELDFIKSFDLDKIIKKSDLEIKVMNCNSFNTIDWYDVTNLYN